jgi:mannose-1-phosphate guanylyltransferase
MKAILLAAGLGTRLRPLTDHTPKCLVSIGGKPLMSIWLDLLFSSGIEKVLINTHYLSEAVEDFISSSPYKDRIEILHEPILLGTAGTLLAAKYFINNEPILLIHADNLSRFSPIEFIRSHELRPPSCNMTMMLFKTDDPKSCGIVEIDRFGVVNKFHEKISAPPSNLANAAIYIIEPDLVKLMASMKTRPTDFSNDVIPNNLGKIFTFLNSDYHRDIGTLESFYLANKEYVD